MFSGSSSTRRVNLSGKKRVIINKEYFIEQGRIQRENTVLQNKQQKAYKAISNCVKHKNDVRRIRKEIKVVLYNQLEKVVQLSKCVPVFHNQKESETLLWKCSLYITFLYSQIECCRHYANKNVQDMYEPVKCLIKEILARLPEIRTKKENEKKTINEDNQEDEKKRGTKNNDRNHHLHKMMNGYEQGTDAHFFLKNETDANRDKEYEKRKTYENAKIENFQEHEKFNKNENTMDNEDTSKLSINTNSHFFRRKKELMLLVNHLDILCGNYYCGCRNIYGEVEKEEILVFENGNENSFFILKKYCVADKELRVLFTEHAYGLYNFYLLVGDKELYKRKQDGKKEGKHKTIEEENMELKIAKEKTKVEENTNKERERSSIYVQEETDKKEMEKKKKGTTTNRNRNNSIQNKCTYKHS